MSKKEIIKYLLLLVFVFAASYYIYSLPYERESKKGISVDKYADTEALLVVAHYEDAVIYASTILHDKDVLVVCLSCGNDEVKDNDLKKILEYTGDQYLFLAFEEYKKEVLDDWISSYDKMEFEVDKILRLRHWQEVYTHHPMGENDIQHKITSRIVTKNAIKERMSKNLNYFDTDNMKLIEYDPQSPWIVYKMSLIDIYTNREAIMMKLQDIGEYFITYESYINNEKV